MIKIISQILTDKCAECPFITLSKYSLQPKYEWRCTLANKHVAVAESEEIILQDIPAWCPLETLEEK